MTTTTTKITNAIETLATEENDANRVERCWTLRGMADAFEAAELIRNAADEDAGDLAVERLHRERQVEAGQYRGSWAKGWSAASNALF